MVDDDDVLIVFCTILLCCFSEYYVCILFFLRIACPKINMYVCDRREIFHAFFALWKRLEAMVR